MLRRLIVLLLIVTMFLASGMTVYAATDSNPGESAGEKASFDKMLADIIQDKDAEDTEQLLVTITMPEEKKEAAYEKSYLLTGIALKSDIRICLAKYNEETKAYEAFENTDGKSYWDVAAGNIFSKEILLEKGANKIKIVAYSTTDTSQIKKDDIQINSFTISLLDKSVKAIIRDAINSITDGISSIFKN